MSGKARGASLPWRPSGGVVLFSGPMGSGKTEVAINFAVAARQGGIEPVRIVDLDFVNPYFCARERREQLTGAGVEVVSAPLGRAGSDIPALPPEVLGALGGGSGLTAVDLGGGRAGAAFMGSLKDYLPPDGADHLFVVNPYRIGARTPEEIAETAKAVEEAVGVPLTALVSNPHLGRATEGREVIEGHRLVERGAARLGLPVAFLACSRDKIGSLGDVLLGVPVLPITFYVRMPWE